MSLSHPRTQLHTVKPLMGVRTTIAVAVLALGVLLGWLLYQGLLALFLHDADVTLPENFPPVIPLITLAGVLALTLVVIRGPLRRATRIQPSTALRYQ